MRVLVTGGGGFLGSSIVRLLHARGDRVTSLARGRHPQIEAFVGQSIQGDIRDPECVHAACRGMDAVIHVASIPKIWGARREFESINIGGTRNVIDACRKCGVTRLVYTSTPSVVFGKGDLCGVDESTPYPEKYLADYPRTKAIAEQMVLAANGPQRATVSLRPHLIWGPGDPHLFPRIIARARAGKLAQVGDGKNLVDITYIDNAAEAHVLALDKVCPGAACAGRAYFISQGEPVELWSWLGKILAGVGAPAIKRRMSFSRARRSGAMLEIIHRVLAISQEPLMTRFLAEQLAKSHYFDITAARRDLGYEPGISTKVGEMRLIEWLRSTVAA